MGTTATSSLFTSSNCAKFFVIFGLGIWIATILLESLLVRELPMWTKLKRWRNEKCPGGGLYESNMGKKLDGIVCCSENDIGDFFPDACAHAYDPVVKFFSG